MLYEIENVSKRGYNMTISIQPINRIPYNL